MKIAGATVLLTGATGGIGQVLARRLIDLGADLVLTARESEALHSLAKDLGARCVPADLADPLDVADLAETCGDVDIFVANAGKPASGELFDYTPEQVDRALMVNLRASIMLTRLLTPAMVRAGKGHLVFMGSVAGMLTTPYSSLYSATKFGLRGFAHALRQDLHGTGVGVSMIQPGIVGDAGMFAKTGVPVAKGMRTVSSDQVATAVIRAIVRDQAEINLAPIELRLLCALAVQFPAAAAWIQRQQPPDNTVQRIAEAQRAYR
ncbi:SDR family NAD(P)-dependent oxidoreductase [Spirillospora albida]|uniref:SDR family NAD(P)-dependent oxidoreductase n=1 Tax=Spirillospora albida TaxID=58123 RepID=UPI0004C280C1|nr:SDR family NAD(P)-dependent oxidoreductase [Spirillospora albida]